MSTANTMLKAIATEFAGLLVLQPRIFQDERGAFVKTYNEQLFRDAGVPFSPREEFFSVSARGVLRGMHFHVPPFAHDKLVYCIAGRVLDVALDMRRQSPTCGMAYARELSAANREMLFIPVGFAHGFVALEDQSVMVYQLSSGYSCAHDAGVMWNSFGFEWPVANPIVSKRDQEFASWANYASPF